ncbi:MAG: general secretion pathway protein GspA, partial [Pirellulales bacterium]|nr:general secretion pathway protein GspA [Pirellulales bacterium]
MTVVLAGDGRLLERLCQPELVPLASRIRTRLITEAASREELSELLSHALAKAGNATLMTPQLRDTLVDHAAGKYRLLISLLAEGVVLTRAKLREALAVKNERLGEALESL